MFDVSNRYKEKIREKAIESNAYIRIIDDNFIVPTQDIKSVKLKDYCNDKGNIIGTAMSKEIEVELFNNSNFDLQNKEIEFRYRLIFDDNTYEEVPYGNFIIQKPKNISSQNRYVIIGNDYMTKFNSEFIDNFTYPMTLWQFYTKVCDYYGVEYEEQEDVLPNTQFIIENRPVFDGNSGRIVLSRIAELFGSFVKVNRFNKMCFYLDEETDETIEYGSMNTQLEITDISNEINTVILELGGGVDGENVIKTDPKELSKFDINPETGKLYQIKYIDEQHILRITDNPFIYSEELREKVIDELFERVNGFSYTAVKFTYIGRFYYDCGDRVKIQDIKTGKYYSTVIMNQFLQIPATRKSTIDSQALTENEVKYQYNSKSKQANTRVELLVDKLNKEITSVVEEVDEQNSKITQIEQTTERIEQSVTMVADLTNTVTGMQKLELPNAMNGYVNELRIKGNNSVLDGKLLEEFEEQSFYLRVTGYPNNKKPYLKYVYLSEETGSRILIYRIKPNQVYTINLKNMLNSSNSEVTVGTYSEYLPNITGTIALNNFISNYSYIYNEETDTYSWKQDINKLQYTIKSGQNDTYLYITCTNENLISNVEVWEAESKLLITSKDLKEDFEIQYAYRLASQYEFEWKNINDTWVAENYKLYSKKATNNNICFILKLEKGIKYRIELDKSVISDTNWVYISTFKENPWEDEITEKIYATKYYGLGRIKYNSETHSGENYINLEESIIEFTAGENENYLIFYSYLNEIFEKSKIYKYYNEIPINYGLALKQFEDIEDEYVIKENVAQVIHRVGVNENGILYKLPQEYIEELGDFPIELTKGMNLVTLSGPANISVNYIIINDLTTKFTSATEFKSTIQLLYNSILLQVMQKVGDEEIIAKLNLAIKDGQGIIELLGNVIKMKSDYFELTENGFIDATGGKIAGFTIGDKVLESDLVGMAQGERYAFWVKQSKNGELIFYTTMSGDIGCKTLLIDGSPAIKTNTQSGQEIKFAYMDANQFVINTGNNLYIVLPDSIVSDKRLKTDIEDTSIEALPIIDKINFRDYKWIETGKQENLSLVADELQEISEELVSEVKGGKFEKTKVINQSKMIYYNSKAIQELHNKLKEKDKTIENLIKRIEKIEMKLGE